MDSKSKQSVITQIQIVEKLYVFLLYLHKLIPILYAHKKCVTMIVFKVSFPPKQWKNIIRTIFILTAEKGFCLLVSKMIIFQISLVNNNCKPGLNI